MESLADETGPETAVRPPARKPGSVPSTAERPLADGHVADGHVADGKVADGNGSDSSGDFVWQPEPTRPVAAQPAPVAPAAAPRPVAKIEPSRRYRQTIHRVDLWSVLKIAVC